jgi:ATP:ADP antiporter, AAA family
MAEEKQKSGILGLFGDVRPGEAGAVFLMLLNITIILICYYIIKVVREPLILELPGGEKLKSYAAAGQALVLMGYVPLYAWFSSKVNRKKLIMGVNIFFLACIEIFAFAVRMKVPYIGVAFFIWVGIFSLSLIAQFWSLANDVYTESQGKRLFPIIAIGATLGSPIGAKLASKLFATHIAPDLILQISAFLLFVSMLLYVVIQRKESQHGDQKTIEKQTLGKSGGFQLLFRSRYLLLLAALLLLLNLVNTTGEFILSAKVKEAAKLAADKESFIGAFYGNYFFIVNIAAFLIQTFLASRIVKYFGIAGVVLALPIVAFGAYTTIAAGVGLAIIRWMKTAENSTDYSVMNTARAMLWLPTSREEKYKAKQAVDTFVVRFGDVFSAALVFVGTTWLGFTATSFAIANIFIVLVWIGIGLLVIRKYKQLSQTDTRLEAANAPR